jgi:hypothetical protein
MQESLPKTENSVADCYKEGFRQGRKVGRGDMAFFSLGLIVLLIIMGGYMT